MKRLRTIGLILLFPVILQANSSISDNLQKKLDALKGPEKVRLLIKISGQNRDKSVYDCKILNRKAFEIAKKDSDKDLMGLADKSMGVNYFYWGDMKSAFQYFKSGLSYYRQSKNKKGQSNCLNDIGLVYEAWANFDSAAYYYKASYNIEKELKNLEGEATSLINMGNIDYYRKNYQGSLKDYFLALQNFSQINDKQGKAMSYNSLAIIYTQLGDYNKALKYLKKAKDIYVASNDNMRLSRVLNNMADIYSDHLKEYQKAKILYEKVLKIKTELGMKEGIALVKSNLGVLYGHLGILSTAMRYLDESKGIYQEIGDKTGLCMIYQNKGKLLLDAGYNQKALKAFQKSLAISKKIGLKNYTINNYQGIFKCYAALGNYKNFIKYYNLFEQSRDTITSKLEKLRVEELEEKYQIDTLLERSRNLEKEKRKNDLQIKRYHIIFIGLLLLIVLLILSFFLFQRAKAESKKYRVKK